MREKEYEERSAASAPAEEAPCHVKKEAAAFLPEAVKKEPSGPMPASNPVKIESRGPAATSGTGTCEQTVNTEEVRLNDLGSAVNPNKIPSVAPAKADSEGPPATPSSKACDHAANMEARGDEPTESDPLPLQDGSIPFSWVPTGKSASATSTLSVKERFQQCDLVVPTIGLKRMRMLREKVQPVVAFCGVSDTSHYKVKRNAVKGMVLGSMKEGLQGLWSKVQEHLSSDTKRFGLLIMFNDCGMTAKDAPRLTHVHPTHSGS